MAETLTAGSVDELIAAAIATTPRPPVLTLCDLDQDARAAVARGAMHRTLVMSAGARVGLLYETVRDNACHGRQMQLVTFIRHCADVQHQPGDVEHLAEDHPERDLGRQGESRHTDESGW